MSDARAPFKSRLKKALASETLPVALDRTMGNMRSRRAAAFEEVDFKELQADVTRRKQAALARLPELVKQFTAEAEKAGAVVHYAEGAEEARAIVGRIAQENGVKLAVKGKSMATEEIELNSYLEGL